MLTTETFAGLIEPKEIGRITLGFTVAIEQSFLDDQARMTQAEVKRRFEICVKIFRELRGDLHWGVQRILSKLPEYLRCELDGHPWTPDTRAMWMPSDR